MRRVVQKLKRKLINIQAAQNSTVEPEETTATPVKRTRICKNHAEESALKKLESKNEDHGCDTVDWRDNISETEKQKKLKGSRCKGKLNSRLSRILKRKSSKVDGLQDSIDSCDTDSRLSADSGIECENNVTTQNEGTSVTSRKKSDIVAMDCEFVGVGPQSRNALGEVSRFVQGFMRVLLLLLLQ